MTAVACGRQRMAYVYGDGNGINEGGVARCHYLTIIGKRQLSGKRGGSVEKAGASNQAKNSRISAMAAWRKA